METFKPNEKVKTIVDGNLEKGRILRVFDIMQTAIVSFENGDVKKVPFSQLMIDRDDADCEKENPGVSKQIDREDFENQLAILTAPENLKIEGVGKIMLFVVGKVLSQKLIEEVFDDKVRVTIDKGTLFDAISKVTNPINAMGQRDLHALDNINVIMCLAVATTFFGILDHYFGDEPKSE